LEQAQFFSNKAMAVLNHGDILEQIATEALFEQGDSSLTIFQRYVYRPFDHMAT
jgi:hypothetical protein